MSIGSTVRMWCLAAGVIAGCGDDGEVGGAAQSGGAGGGQAQSGGGGAAPEGGGLDGGATAGGGGAAPANARARAVHLSPGAPAVDFCLVPENGAAVGPMLEAAALPDGVSYPGATPYLEISGGSYMVRVLPASASSCDEGAAPDEGPFALSATATYSIAAVGMLSPEGADAPFELVIFEDDNTVEQGKVRMRFVHASPDTPAVDVGLGSGDGFTPIWTNVSYPEVGLVAGEGYLSIDPPTNAQISARASGTTADALIIDGVSIPPGEVVTTFAIGNLDGDPAPLKVLACLDVAGFCLELPAN
jgi:hypothetical protein